MINLVVSNIISRKRINITRVQMRDAGKLAATNLSLKIRPGQYVAIVGATGCGKSTLMRLMLGKELSEDDDLEFVSAAGEYFTEAKFNRRENM